MTTGTPTTPTGVTTITMTSALAAETVRAWFNQRAMGRIDSTGDLVMLDGTTDPEFGLPVLSVTVQDGPKTPLDGLTEHTTSIGEFTAAVAIAERGGDHVMDAQVAHLATIGADWYVFQRSNGTGINGYVIAQQGHSGGDGLGPTRKRQLTWWSTNDGLSMFAAWNVAIEFITAQVHADLKDEWGE